jgi:hypothetical protein
MRCVGLILLAVLALPASALADVNIVISKSQQEMVVSIDGGPAYRWPVSTGRSGYNTPSGSFNAIRLERVYYSKKYDDAPMPNSVFFYGGYAIHGTLEERGVARLRAARARQRRGALRGGAGARHEPHPHPHHRRPDLWRACRRARL